MYFLIEIIVNRGILIKLNEVALDMFQLTDSWQTQSPQTIAVLLSVLVTLASVSVSLAQNV